MEALYLVFLFFFKLTGIENPSPSSPQPTINFVYSPWVDNYLCPLKRMMPANEKRMTLSLDPSLMRAELEKELPPLQAVWDQTGPNLLRKSAEILNTTFAYTHDKTGVFLCPHLSDWSKPRLIPVWRYMPSIPATDRGTDGEFVNAVLHAHLHMLVHRLMGWNFYTPILEKYKFEEFQTKNHIHLYAVEKEVYRQLGMTKEWKEIEEPIRKESRQYTNALDIADKYPVAELIGEIRQPN